MSLDTMLSDFRILKQALETLLDQKIYASPPLSVLYILNLKYL